METYDKATSGGLSSVFNAAVALGLSSKVDQAASVEGRSALIILTSSISFSTTILVLATCVFLALLGMARQEVMKISLGI